ncbi:MAG: class F sortase [Actinomycetota bacterium]
MKTMGIVAAAAGIILATAALVLAARLQPEAGDVERLEMSLRGPEPTPAGAGTVPTTAGDTSGTATTATARPRPRWETNPESLLAPSRPREDGGAPQRLRIPAIGVDAPVGPYGVDAGTGQMAVPADTTEVGWYRFGPSPGQPGSAVLAAHVDLAGQGPGVFFRLAELEPGDRIEIVTDEGEARVFSVEARATYRKDELPSETVFSREGDPVLTLVTCGGAFDPAASRYDSNVVVYARPVDERLDSPPGVEGPWR